jgi:hypothetical protein
MPLTPAQIAKEAALKPVRLELPLNILRMSRNIAHAKKLSLSAFYAELFRQYLRDMEKATMSQHLTPSGATAAELRASELSVRIAKLRAVGNLMSNLCFNGAQQSSIPADYRARMDELWRNWDKAVSK